MPPAVLRFFDTEAAATGVESFEPPAMLRGWSPVRFSSPMAGI